MSKKTISQQKCKKCNKPLFEIQVVKGDIFHFNGMLLRCNTCGIITFPMNFLYLDKEQILISNLKTKELGGIESEFIILLPFGSNSNKNDILISIGKNRLDRDSAVFIEDVSKLSLISFVIKSPFFIEIEFSGYSKDTREVWEIDEIKRRVTYLFQTQPDFICFLTLKGLKTVMMILLNALADEDIFDSYNSYENFKFLTDDEKKVIKAHLILLKGLTRWKYLLLYSKTLTDRDFNEYRLDFIKRYYNAFQCQANPLNDPLNTVKI